MLGHLSPEEIKDFIGSQKFARLGCHLNGETYVVPISFVLDGEQILGQTTLGKKIAMMRGNPEVCVELDEIVDLANWRSVVLTGTFQELNGIEAGRAMGLLIDKYGPILSDMPNSPRRGRDIAPPRMDAEPANAVVYCIHIKEQSGRFERTG